MLTYLSVKNLAIVSELVLNFDSGMHVITGETGAGKSIIIDALSIALGERASSDQIRAQQRQAEVTVTFDLQNLPLVIELLRDQDLAVEHECIIRRIINADGPSRAYINGYPVTAQQIKSIAPHLVHIHSQHQHHALLESDYQRQILDSYAQHDHLLLKVKESYNAWFDVTQQSY
jgi:DNA repair protein RecN (Recombination protein N)